MFSSPQEKQCTTLTTKTFMILSLPGMQRSPLADPKSHNLIAFELVNPLLYIYFPSFECRSFLKDLKSTFPSSVVLWFRNLAIRDLKHDDAFNTTWPPVLSVDKCCQVTSSSIERTDHHVLLKASSCLRSKFYLILTSIVWTKFDLNIE